MRSRLAQPWSELAVVFSANGDTLRSYFGNRSEEIVQEKTPKKLDIFLKAWGNAFESNLRVRNQIVGSDDPWQTKHICVCSLPAKQSLQLGSPNSYSPVNSLY